LRFSGGAWRGWLFCFGSGLEDAKKRFQKEDSVTKVEIEKWMMVVLLGFALSLGVIVPGSTYPSRALASVSTDKPDKPEKHPPVSVPEHFGTGDLLIVLAAAGVGCWTLIRVNVLRVRRDRN
jgi:hypothetical protein